MKDIRSYLPRYVLALAVLFALPWLFLLLIPSCQVSRLAPQLLSEEEGGGVYPLNKTYKGGAIVYQREGCANCHTQVIRDPSMGSDHFRKGWGKDQGEEGKPAPTRPSRARDYLGEKFALLGQQRSGPDLSNVGYRRPEAAWHFQHLYQPRSIHNWSTMPAFRHLFEVRKIEGQPSEHALDLPIEHDVAGGYEVVPNKEARALVNYLLSLKRDSPAPSGAAEVVAKAIEVSDAVEITTHDLGGSVSREKADPVAGSGGFPAWALGACLALLASSFLFAYCSSRPSDFSAVVDNRPADGPQLSEEEKLARLGKKTFANNCNSCHVNGVGSPGLYPPLDASPYVTDSAERLIAIILHGVKGDFLYDGVTYGRAAVMPPQPIGDDKALAAVVNYVRNQWSNSSAKQVTPEQVAFVRAKYGSEKDQWVQADLDSYQDSSDFPAFALPTEEAPNSSEAQ